MMSSGGARLCGASLLTFTMIVVVVVVRVKEFFEQPKAREKQLPSDTPAWKVECVYTN